MYWTIFESFFDSLNQVKLIRLHFCAHSCDSNINSFYLNHTCVSFCTSFPNKIISINVYGFSHEISLSTHVTESVNEKFSRKLKNEKKNNVKSWDRKREERNMTDFLVEMINMFVCNVLAWFIFSLSLVKKWRRNCVAYTREHVEHRTPTEKTPIKHQQPLLLYLSACRCVLSFPFTCLFLMFI
jgi:hypothetical protein